MMSEAETTANKSLVQEFYDLVFSRADTSNIDRFIRSDCIQHNPTCADGKTGFLALGPQIDIIEHNVEGVQSRNDNGPFWPSNSVRGLLCSITCRKSWPLLICLCEDCTWIFTNHTALLEPYSPYLMHL